MKTSCPLNTSCRVHDYFHGAEAEELREGIEKLCKIHKKNVPVGELAQLLDQVDARDSCAYLEAEKEE